MSVIIKMSGEGDTAKSPPLEAKEKSDEAPPNAKESPKPVENNATPPRDDKKNDAKAESPEKVAEKPKPENDKAEEKPKPKVDEPADESADDKKGEESADTKDSAKETEESEDGSEKDDPKVPLLDQPLEKSGKRDRKNVQRFSEEPAVAPAAEPKENAKAEANGSGCSLSGIPRVDACISRFKNDDMKLLHRLLYDTPGKNPTIKKNVRKFNGFPFKKDSDEYNKKLAAVHKCEVKHLKSICEMLDLQKTGVKDEIVERIMEFLLEPKDSGKAVTGAGGRPKRTAAVRANNRGYSSHDNYSSDERHSGRSSRDKGRRANLKEDSSSHSDEDFEPSDDEEEDKPRVTKRRSVRSKNYESDEDEDVSDVESPSSDDSDFQEEPKSKRKSVTPKVNNKSPRGRGTGRRGRPPASAAKKNTRGRKRNKETSEEEEEESDQKEEEGSSSEDEPLVKKAKTAEPPTDDQIKSYVKEILDGANLEQITMKTVCQQVYAHYPDFDLAHKKDFIKTTVKSLIST